MNFIIALIIICSSLEKVEGQPGCDVCDCRPFFTDCASVSNPPVFDEVMAYNTETLILNAVTFDTQEMSNNFIEVFVNLKKLIALYSQLDCAFIAEYYQDRLLNMTMIDSCYQWMTTSVSSAETTTTTTTTKTPLTSIITTTAQQTFSSTIDDDYLTISNNNTTTISNSDNDILPLAITTGIGFLLCATLTSLLCIIYIRRGRINFNDGGMERPQLPHFPAAMAMDTFEGNIAVNHEYEEPVQNRRDSSESEE